ncbi:copper resistance CopC/CopD family protein [Alicyclobacillus dauci]|uniref:Copper resistance protein CopC n=1 Tax=Alicyclobacillus dauci TaxID=1475485 RepID=A0ABY6Z7E3_9BACL|nr:copper resistance protein CopC [Alicyclobacillus dauci]WAH38809.1 copper resistance protein CopC [Alicyclobacillus dauci]
MLRMLKGWAKTYIWVAAIILSMFVLPPTVSAHAYVVQSTPSTNQTFQTAPVKVDVQFDESVQLGPQGLTVTDEDGHRVDNHNGHLVSTDPHEIECTLPSHLNKGVYTVHWQVLSSDGHMVEGTIPFGVQVDVKSMHLGATQSGYTPGPAMIVDRVCFYLSMCLVIGLSVFFRFLWPESAGQQYRGRRLAMLIVSWVGLVVSTGFSLPVQTAISWSVHGMAAFQAKYLLRTMNLTLFGDIWVIQMLLLIVFPPIIGALVGTGVRYRWWWMATPMLGIPVTKAFVGHAMVQSPPTVPIIADIIHLFAASVWLGGMVGVILLMSGGSRPRSGLEANDLAETVRKFSVVAGSCVLVLGGTGFYAALLNVPTWTALWSTSYGRSLAIKIALYLLMVLLAAVHWTRRKRIGIGSFRNLVASELLVGVLLLGVTSVLTNLPTAAIAPGPVHASQMSNKTRIGLDITPNRVGNNQFEVTIMDANGQPVTDIQQVTLSFSSASVSEGADDVRLKPLAPGKYGTSGLYLSGGGRWTVDVHVLTTQFTDLDEKFSITVGQ